MSEAIIIAGCDLLGRLSKNEGLPSDTSVTIVVISPHACAYADLRGRLSTNEVKGYCDMSAHADVSNACVCVCCDGRVLTCVCVLRAVTFARTLTHLAASRCQEAARARRRDSVPGANPAAACVELPSAAGRVCAHLHTEDTSVHTCTRTHARTHARTHTHTNARAHTQVRGAGDSRMRQRRQRVQDTAGRRHPSNFVGNPPRNRPPRRVRAASDRRIAFLCLSGTGGRRGRGRGGGGVAGRGGAAAGVGTSGGNVAHRRDLYAGLGVCKVCTGCVPAVLWLKPLYSVSAKTSYRSYYQLCISLSILSQVTTWSGLH